MAGKGGKPRRASQLPAPPYLGLGFPLQTSTRLAFCGAVIRYRGEREIGMWQRIRIQGPQHTFLSAVTCHDAIATIIALDPRLRITSLSRPLGISAYIRRAMNPIIERSKSQDWLRNDILSSDHVPPTSMSSTVAGKRSRGLSVAVRSITAYPPAATRVPSCHSRWQITSEGPRGT